MISIPVSYGELFDKLSILSIKKEKITDLSKLDYINSEYNILLEMCHENLLNDNVYKLYAKLLLINSNLWDVEDLLRKYERDQDFGFEFILNARQVYKLNDQRYLIKNEINMLLNSQVREMKEYVDYQ